MSKSTPERVHVRFCSPSGLVQHTGSPVVKADGTEHPRGCVLEQGDTLFVHRSELEHPQGRNWFEPVNVEKPKRRKRTTPDPMPEPEAPEAEETEE